MRRKTVRTGLRLLSTAIFLLILGAFYSRELAGILFFSPGGAVEFVQLAFFWSGMLGGVGIIMICAGLLRATVQTERIRILPSLALLLIMLGLFFLLFMRALTAPPELQPLQPGETLVI